MFLVLASFAFPVCVAVLPEGIPVSVFSLNYGLSVGIL